MSGSIDLFVKDRVAYIHLNNPEKKNAISAEMWEGIKSKAEEVAADESIRATVIRGTGSSAFAAGADISQFESKRSASAEGSTYDSLTESAIAAVKAIPVPVIALIHGYCLGGGVSLALACDLRFCSTEAKFAVPAARLGISYPTPAVERLCRLIGPSNAKYLLFSAKRIDAHSAKEMRLVDKISDSQQLDQEVDDFVMSIADNAPLSLKAAKFIIDQFQLESSHRDVPRMNDVARRCFESEDYKEGVRAFMAQRRPEFQGR